MFTQDISELQKQTTQWADQVADLGADLGWRWRSRNSGAVYLRLKDNLVYIVFLAHCK